MNYKLLLFLVVLCAVQACSSKMEQLNNYNIDATFPQQSVENLDLKYYSSHKMRTTVTAPQADDYEHGDVASYLEFPKGVDVIFYDEELKQKSRLTADYAVYYKKKHLYEARRNVVITNDDGTTLKTEQIFCDENKQKIFSVKRVMVAQPGDGFVIDGKSGFESDLTFKNYRFLDVNGVVELRNEYQELNVSSSVVADSTNVEQ
ncbi:MAG: LPS export ABC transporter periplasmic protein LptC [Bacteroidales bacterium]|nr:LPS export ABC transporter periplasmic protein LptC [Bacteroidales bacterium]